jgi:glycerate kinase
MASMPLKIVIAPDSYKESLSASKVAAAIESGFKIIFPDANYIKIPFADGGEGTVQAFITATNGHFAHVPVINPVGNTIEATYGVSACGTRAIIEMAAASGLELISEDQRNPYVTTTHGTGQLIQDALDKGIRQFTIGIGGSATNDAGAGMLQALGARLLDKKGQQIGFGGAELARLVHINMSSIDQRLYESRFDIACDVRNPLTGKDGASAVFGPQKGASATMIAVLDRNLAHFARCLSRSIGRDFSSAAGSGAGGGIGLALMSLPNATLRAGVEVMIDALDLSYHLEGADLLITGEGRTDGQTTFGKTPVGVAKTAQERGIPVINIAGALKIDADATYKHGISAQFSAVRQPCTLQEAMESAADNLQAIARDIAAAIKIGMTIKTID